MATEYEVIQQFQDSGFLGKKSSMGDFNKEVTSYLKKGWNLSGGISVVHDSKEETLIYFQAVYRDT